MCFRPPQPCRRVLSMKIQIEYLLQTTINPFMLYPALHIDVCQSTCGKAAEPGLSQQQSLRASIHLEVRKLSCLDYSSFCLSEARRGEALTLMSFRSAVYLCPASAIKETAKKYTKRTEYSR